MRAFATVRVYNCEISQRPMNTTCTHVRSHVSITRICESQLKQFVTAQYSRQARIWILKKRQCKRFCRAL